MPDSPPSLREVHAINGDGNVGAYLSWRATGWRRLQIRARWRSHTYDRAATIARLIGRRATAQLIASSRAADGSVQDQTRAVEWVSLNPEIAQLTAKGQVVPRANGTATIVARLGSHRSPHDRHRRGHGSARAGQLSPRRDPGVQPGGLQHGRLPRDADGQGGVSAELARISARPRFRDPLARGRRPADQPHRAGRPA